MHPVFNLIDEAWIPGITQNRRDEVLSLRDVFRRSMQLAEVRAPSPLGTAALLRLLIAVSHAALRGPEDTPERVRLWKEPHRLLEEVDGYLTRWHDRFDLFHPEYPFWQEAALQLEKPRRIAFIALEVSAPEEFALFDPPIDKERYAASPAEAARYLVTRQAYTLGGLDRAGNQPYGAQLRFENSPPLLGALVFVRGKSLLETVLLNLVPYTERTPIPVTGEHADVPIWERDELPWSPGERNPDGYLDYLTWPSSAVRLEPEMEDGKLAVRRVHVCARNKVSPPALQGDPFFAWRETQPLTLRRGRALWRDSGALFGFAAEGKARQVGQVPKPGVLRELEKLASKGVSAEWSLVVLGADSERSKQQVHMWRAEALPLPTSVLSDVDAIDAVARAVRLGEAVGGTLRGTLQEMAREYLSLYRPKTANADDVGKLARSWSADALYWQEMDVPFRHFLHEVGTEAPDLDGAYVTWADSVRRVAWRAFHHAARQIGDDAPAFRARIHGERLLGGALSKHLPAKETA